MSHTLEVLPVDPARPTAILKDLEEALSGQRCLLPVPTHDPARADILRASQRAGQPIDDSLSLVVATSGSTGTPKGAQLSATNLISSADATHEALGGPGQWLLAMPAHHIAGIQVLVRSLVAGIDPLFVDISSGFSIDDFATATQELTSTGDRSYTSLAPNQLAKAMDHLHGIEALRSFDAVLVGGAATHPRLLKAAKELRINVVTTYGASESSGGVVYNGSALPGAQVRIRDGRIFLGGPMIANGYRNHPNHEAFAEPGWFATSDGGFFDRGKLVVSGRLDAIIDSGGFKIHPELLERELTRIDGVDEAVVVGIPHERFGQAIVAAYTGSATLEDILTGIADLPRWQHPKDYKLVHSLPRTATGKIDRPAVAKLWN